MSPEEWLRDQAQQVPPIAGPPDGPHRIRNHIRARARLAPATVAAVVVAVAAGVSWVAVAGKDGPNNGPATAPAVESPPDAPWIDAPGEQYNSPADHWRRWRACDPGDIATTAGRSGAGHGLATEQFYLENASTSDCRLTGPPQIIAIAPRGAHPVKPGSFAGTVLPLGAGAKAIMVVGGPAGCGTLPSEAIAREVDISMEDAPARRFSDVWLPVGCGEPRLAVFEIIGADPALLDGLSALEATWQGPASASPGETLNYVIALHNPTAEAITLDSCPSYTQEAEDLLSEMYLLNCEAVPSIGAGESKTFAMRMSIPETDNSSLKIGWHLEVEAGTTAGVLVTVN